MYAQVTLYKSGFSPSNVFVGDGTTPRPQSLSTLPHLTITRCPFNPNDPFRIAGNAYNYERLWDYARFLFYTEPAGGNPVFEQSFFIYKFQYVNDNVCRLIGDYDTLGELFYKITDSEFTPQYATYKTADSPGMPMTFRNMDDAMIYDSKFLLGGGLPVYTLSGEEFIVGAVIITTSGSAFTWEFGISYPVQTLLLPFAVSKETGNINKLKSGAAIDFYWQSYASNNIISDPSYLYQLIQKLPTTGDGEKIESSNISFEVVSYEMRVEAYTTNKFILNSLYTENSFQLITYQTDRKWLQFVTHNTPAFKSYINTPLTDFTFRNPLRELRISWGNNVQRIDPIMFYGSDGTLKSNRQIITYSISYLPPYNITFNFDVPLGRTSEQYAIVIETYNPYTTFEDGFAEWLRTNYNSQIMGLKVQQNLRQQNANIGYLTEAGNTLLNPSPRRILNAIEDIGTTQYKIENQNAAENELLELKLADMKNLTDTFNFGTSLRDAWLKRNYLEIAMYKNIQLDSRLKEISAYGFYTGLRTTLAKKHTRYDYYKGTGLILKEKNIFMSQEERADIINRITTGVRVWYTLNDFLSIENNPEYSA